MTASIQRIVAVLALLPDETVKIRIDPDLLERIDRGAKRLGISRSAFLVSSAAEKLERMEDAIIQMDVWAYS